MSIVYTPPASGGGGGITAVDGVNGITSFTAAGVATLKLGGILLENTTIDLRGENFEIVDDLNTEGLIVEADTVAMYAGVGSLVQVDDTGVTAGISNQTQIFIDAALDDVNIKAANRLIILADTVRTANFWTTEALTNITAPVSGTQNLIDYTQDPPGFRLMRVALGLTVTAIDAGVILTVTLSWTDPNSNPQVQTYAPFTAIGNVYDRPIIIMIQDGSTITVDATQSGAAGSVDYIYFVTVESQSP